ncbi:MAG: DUF4294 domain-containing protein [Chitinophagaceae bacterium]|jgi:hypothetical protein|nr:DUF4294 domain-containing protein [Chitinophagaceae bacterium]
MIRFVCVILLTLRFCSPAIAQCSLPDPLKWGINDTVLTSAICYEGALIPYKESEMAWVSKMSEKQLEKYKREYDRLRNAVYVTYPFARTAGVTLNEIQLQLTNFKSKKEKNNYLKSREKELKDQFADPLTNLSVYQGRVLMKLINRQTGNNCYSIIKEYKGGVSARLYQTVAFFFGSSLKQDYDLRNVTDRQIEIIVNEIDGMWYNNYIRPMSSVN